MNLFEQMERIYRDIPLDRIPWHMSEPPALLVEAVETGKITPCKAVDLGCGAGTYTIWMAGRGFDMTGIDFSREAIKHAEDLAVRQRVSCRFAVADLLGDVSGFRAGFEFAYDWEVLHHIFPEDRSRYVQNVSNMLRPAGRYFSMCFSESDPAFSGRGKIRETPLGTTLYFSSEAELEKLYAPRFRILELTTVEVSGKRGLHMANVAWLEARQK